MPYNCPVQCKCQFDNGQDDEENSYDYERESVKVRRLLRRRRRRWIELGGSFGKSNTTTTTTTTTNKPTVSSGDYSYDSEYSDREEEAVSGGEGKKRSKYDIKIDCSGQGLQTIADLFDYDFPMDQIVTL